MEEVREKFHGIGAKHGDVLAEVYLEWFICDFRLGTYFLGVYGLLDI